MKLPILAMAPNNWSGMWMNRQQLLSRLGAIGWPILYSTGRLSLWSRQAINWRMSPLFSTTERHHGVVVDIPGKLTSRWPSCSAWEHISLNRHSHHLLKRVKYIRHENCNEIILYLFHPSFYPYVEKIRPKFLVYHAYDVFALSGDWEERLVEYESRLVQEADLVIGTTNGVIEAFPGPKRIDAIELLNAADVPAFLNGPQLSCPIELARIPKPRIGYVGNISIKVDLPMIAEIARRRPEWNWVMVGPVKMPESFNDRASLEVKDALEKCRKMKNVHFLGAKPHSQLPAFVGHMDVNTMCYRADGGWWNFAYPLKLHEYLAVGAPIVSVILQRLKAFEHLMEFASTADEWEAALERALLERTPGTMEMRQAIAHQNSWDKRVSQLDSHLIQMIDDRSRENAIHL